MPENVLRMSVACERGGHELAPAGSGSVSAPDVVVAIVPSLPPPLRERLGAPGGLPLAVLDQALRMPGVLDACPARRG